MAKKINLLDRSLLDAASNGWTGEQMEAEYGLPAASAISRVRELLASADIWDEIEQRRLMSHSLRKLKEQVESVIDPSNPKHVESLMKVVMAVDRISSKQGAISDSEIEKLAIAQAQQLIQLIEMSFTRARLLLADEYPDVDLGAIDNAFYEALRENTKQIEA